MSAPPVRRLKNPFNSSGHRFSSRPSTPSLSADRHHFSRKDFPHKSTAQENPNFTSRRPKNPVVQDLPRVVKKPLISLPIASAVVKPGLRRSMPSLPRGASANASDFARILSDLRKQKVIDDERLKPLSSAQNSEVDTTNLGHSSNLKELVVDNSCFDCTNNDVDSTIQPIEDAIVIENCKSDTFVVQDQPVDSNVLNLSTDDSGFIELKVSKTVTLDSEINQTNLGQRLDFLEEKANRIMSDIRRTKEVLEMREYSGPKMAMLEIHEMISKIEKEMGPASSHVCENEGVMVGMGEANEKRVRPGERCDHGKVASMDPLVKGLSREELEERLLPHYKLLRNNPRVGSSQINNCIPHVTFEGKTKVERASLSLNEESIIALEFLASLSKDRSKGCVGSQHDISDSNINRVEDMDDSVTSRVRGSSSVFDGISDTGVITTISENTNVLDDRENKRGILVDVDPQDICVPHINEIGCKTSTGGWFTSEGQAVLLAHDDGSCSFYDIANSEVKTEYKPPPGISRNAWRDCWIIRAAGGEGCSGRYVVAASAGNTMDSGFCSWDFYTKRVQAFHMEGVPAPSRTILGPIQGKSSTRGSLLRPSPENRQWWFKPCGPIIISAASSDRLVNVYDIRDGERVMKWDLLNPMASMDYSSPLQWRNRGKVVAVESGSVSLFDVASLTPRSLVSIPTQARRVSALHINNADAELGGGIRQRVSSTEAGGNDGVFCTGESINVIDFRHPTGVGLKIVKAGLEVQSVCMRGGSVFAGCTSGKVGGRRQQQVVEHFSLRKQRAMNTYVVPDSNAHPHHAAITQVWGGPQVVMCVSGLGLFVFDPARDGAADCNTMQRVKQVVGPDDMYWPSFDYSSSRVLIISRDRPAIWKFLM